MRVSANQPDTSLDIEIGVLPEPSPFKFTGHGMWMADRAAQSQAAVAAKQAGATGADYGASASSIGSTLVPTLTRDINNPTGFSPTEKNNMLVASEQGAGGANAGITGAAGLTANRTRNSSALSSVLDQAARDKSQALSGNALSIQNKDAMLAQQKRAAALGGLQGLYGTDVGAQLKSMGIQDQDINTEIEAGKSGWLQNAEGGLSALSGAYKSVAQGMAAGQGGGGG
jgi:hypothetical protein